MSVGEVGLCYNEPYVDQHHFMESANTVDRGEKRDRPHVVFGLEKLSQPAGIEVKGNVAGRHCVELRRSSIGNHFGAAF